MYVKRLQSSDIEEALKLAWEVFELDVAPTYSQEGIDNFKEFIKYENMLPRVQNREMSFFGAIEGTELCGISTIRSDGEVSLLFVRKKWQRKGAARKLCYAMQQYCIIERNIRRMTVSATPNAVEAYKRLGFIQLQSERVVNGIHYVPMVYLIKDAKAIAGGLTTPRKRKFSKVLYWIILVAVFTLNCIGAKYMVESMYGYEDGNKESIILPGNENSKTENETVIDDNADSDGIESVECYIAEDLPYTITEGTYHHYSDGDSGEYPMEFDIKYPQIEGTGSEKENEINQMLEDCAMSTVNVFYLNPSEEIKEAMIKLQNPVLLSGVTYKVTYASEDFISVVFQDIYYAGDLEKGYVDLRTRNINLKDGTVYEVKDIIEFSDEFISVWKERMKKENPNASFLKELRTSELIRILDGDIIDGNYYENFFLDQNGLQIGMTYHHSNEKFMENGWTTAEFSMDEIKLYQLDNEFWSLIG